MMVLSVTLLMFYTVLIGCFYFGFLKVPDFKTKREVYATGFSGVIPFRNEADYLPELLQSIAALDYDDNRFEVLLINDGSTDESEALVHDFIKTHSQLQVRLLQNKRVSNSPKKDAISLAISQAKFDWILTTDADCKLPKTWLRCFNSFIQHNPCQFIIAPVTYFTTSRFLNIFQWFDFMSLQGATLGGFGINKPFLCNGANLAYTKQAFNGVNGFQENDSIASGDDIFLLEKISDTYPESVHYLKAQDAVVYTHSQSSLQGLLNQRKRWASKTKAYKNTFSQLTGLLVFSMNALLLSLFILMCFGDFSPLYFLGIALVKCGMDFGLIYKSAQFFNQKGTLIWYPFAAILYPIFCTFVAVSSVFTTYKWKDRAFSK
ncbi:glycosyltransferase family 2 protein [Formosa haliotis]|uniref:glycosyltransferase family 2 protein n=1 Tax=Formosa haliotis TaxID=1555194 RepID=UPI000824785D|nr:glycosyltransferase [Formosa haliotis]